jgi:hypothetical protein
MKQFEGAIVKNYGKEKMKPAKAAPAAKATATAKPAKPMKSKKQPHPNAFEAVRKMMKKGK